MVSEFRAFLVQTNALALAVGVIIGVALGNVVNSLVADIIMPPIGVAIGNVDFGALAIDLNGDGHSDIRYGAFLNTIITFVIVSFVVWRISKAFIKPAPEPEPLQLKECPYCREQVPAAATKCKFCTSAL